MYDSEKLNCAHEKAVNNSGGGGGVILQSTIRYMEGKVARDSFITINWTFI